MGEQIYNFLKSYIRHEEEYETNQLMQVVYSGSIFRLSVERLVYRVFYENDYKLYSSNKSLRLNQYRVILFMRGSNSIIINSKKRVMKEGTVLLLPPGQQPSITPKSKGEFVVIVYAFNLINEKGNCLIVPFHELLNLYTGEAGIGGQYIFQLNDFQKEKLVDIFEKYYRSLYTKENHNGMNKNAIDISGSPWEICKIQMELFQFISNIIGSYGSEARSNRPDNMEKVREKIERYYNMNLSVDELSREAGLSRTHFLYSFKKLYGISPIQYQLQLRINAAKELLANTDMACKVISEMVGMSSVYYFSRIFSKSTGIAPIQYRKKCSAKFNKI